MPAMDSSSTAGSRMSRWLREPLLQFLILGGLLSLVSRLVAHDEARTRIVVDAPRVERLAQLYALQTGGAPTPAQREQLVQGFVRDEMLVREARRLQLDDGDELVRRRLVQKMEFLLASSAEVAPPGEGALRRFHRDHAARFASPARVSFVHVFFSPDGRGAEGARAAASAALARHGASDPEPPVGDRAPLPTRFERATPEELQLAFGQRPILPALLQAPPGRWVGPLESGLGWHLVRVTERQPAASPAYEQVRGDVEAAWRREAQQQAERERLATLARGYRVVREDAAGGSLPLPPHPYPSEQEQP